MRDIYDITEERFEELLEWDRNYEGGPVKVTKAELLELMAFDAQCFEGANYHRECAGLVDLMEIVEKWEEDPPIGKFAYSVGDLGAAREFDVL